MNAPNPRDYDDQADYYRDLGRWEDDMDFEGERLREQEREIDSNSNDTEL